jgi:hypothetical protein
VHTQVVTINSSPAIQDFLTPIEFTDGTVDGLRFTSSSTGTPSGSGHIGSFSDFDDTLTFHFEEAQEPSAAPAPPGVVLFAVGLVGLGCIRVLRRRPPMAAA